MNITSSLKVGCHITREDDRKLWVAFRYERLTDFCYGCGRVDHTLQACPMPQEEYAKFLDEKQNFGPWMRTKTLKTSPSPKNNHQHTTFASKPPSENHSGKATNENPLYKSAVLSSPSLPRYVPPTPQPNTFPVRNPKSNTLHLPSDLPIVICSRQFAPQLSPCPTQPHLTQSSSSPLFELEDRPTPPNSSSILLNQPIINSGPNQQPILICHKPQHLLASPVLEPICKKRPSHNAHSNSKKLKAQILDPPFFSSFAQLNIQSQSTAPRPTQTIDNHVITEEVTKARVMITHRRFIHVKSMPELIELLSLLKFWRQGTKTNPFPLQSNLRGRRCAEACPQHLNDRNCLELSGSWSTPDN